MLTKKPNVQDHLCTAQLNFLEPSIFVLSRCDILWRRFDNKFTSSRFSPPISCCKRALLRQPDTKACQEEADGMKVANLTLRSHNRNHQMIYHQWQIVLLRRQKCFFHAVIREEKYIPFRIAQSLSNQRITNTLAARSAFKAIAFVTSLETRRRFGSCDIFTECAVAHGSKRGSWDGSLLKTSTTVATCLNVLVIFI
jgi:hypothetical protein